MTRPSTVLAVAAFMTFLAACDDPTSAPDVPATNATEAPALPVHADALPTTDGEAFDELIASLRGTPVVVNFWASWCTPCRAEAPRLADAHTRFGHDVQFIGVDMQDSRDGADRFIDEYAVRYPSVFDPGNEIGVRWELPWPPMTLFYDAAGELVARVPGEISAADLEEHLRQIAS